MTPAEWAQAQLDAEADGFISLTENQEDDLRVTAGQPVAARLWVEVVSSVRHTFKVEAADATEAKARVNNGEGRRVARQMGNREAPSQWIVKDADGNVVS